MTRQLPAAKVDRSLATKYFNKANRFRRDAEHMQMFANEFSGNGIAVLCIHAAIAYGDSLTIIAAGKKSKSGDHRDGARFLASIIPIRSMADKAALRAFQTVLNRKDEVSYADDFVDELDALAMLQKLQQFAHWAEQTFRNLQAQTPLGLI